jgi:hypothetical protein
VNNVIVGLLVFSLPSQRLEHRLRPGPPVSAALTTAYGQAGVSRPWGGHRVNPTERNVLA